MNPENYDKAEAERITRDLLRTLRDHHMGGVLSVDIPTSGIARAMADHISLTPLSEAAASRLDY